MISRAVTEDLLEYLDYFPVIGLVGPRQVGKTTLAKQLASEIEGKETIYIDLENPKDASKLNDPVLFFENNEHKCVILDEIQRMPKLFPILRSMIDANRVPARFILLGSASPELIRDSSESLAGRIIYKELTPFNLLEIQEIASVDYHWFSGGYPDAFRLKRDKLRRVWMSNFVKTYVERDLPMLGLDTDRLIIRKLWIMLAHMHGNVVNYSNISKSLELTSPTIKRYMSFLEDAFLIRILQPYATNVKKRLVKSPKVYIRDSGMLHHLLSIPTRDDLSANPILGSSWEGYVIEQIAQVLPEEISVFYYRTQAGAECNLVLVKGKTVVASVEVKYTSTPKTTKGLLQSFEDLDAAQNFIITPNTDDYLLTKAIRVCNINDFLNKYVSLL